MHVVCALLCGNLWLQPGCGDPVQGHIDAIVEGGEGLEDAKMALNLARGDAVGPLQRAFEDRSLPVRARLDLADALYRLYLREHTPAILARLVAALQDPEPEIRRGVTRAIGNLRKVEAITPLLDQLAADTDPDTQLEILTTLEFMSLQNQQINTSLLSEAQRDSLSAHLARMVSDDQPDTLRKATREWLEVLAEDRSKEAQKLYLAADVSGAEELLLSALALVPDSKNIGQKLGRMYFEDGDRSRGLSYLADRGLVTSAVRLPATPAIDGRLDEPAWAQVQPLTEFYQCIWRMSAYPIEGRSEAYVGYRDQTLYFLIKGYEPSTEGLVAERTQRDANDLSRDDCIEIFLDTNLDSRTYYHFLVNSLGTVVDARWPGEGQEPRTWSTDVQVAASVSGEFWIAEIAIPAPSLEGASFASGDIWGFNVARVRIGNASEYGQWVPTYGAAHRPDRFGFLLFE